MSGIRNDFDKRSEKAQLLSKHVVITVKNETAMVPSFSDPSKMYQVNIKEETCECPDNTHRHIQCMHLQAVDYFLLDEVTKKNNLVVKTK